MRRACDQIVCRINNFQIMCSKKNFINLMMGKLMVTMAMNVKDITISTIGPPSLLLTITVSIISSSSSSELCRIVMVSMRVAS